MQVYYSTLKQQPHRRRSLYNLITTFNEESQTGKDLAQPCILYDIVQESLLLLLLTDLSATCSYHGDGVNLSVFHIICVYFKGPNPWQVNQAVNHSYQKCCLVKLSCISKMLEGYAHSFLKKTPSLQHYRLKMQCCLMHIC